MKRVGAAWAALSRGQKLVLGAVAAGVGVACVLVVIGFVQRPGDVSNPDAAFDADQGGDARPLPPDRSVNWPRYGYDTERTKFLNAQQVRPPYRKVWKYDQDQLIEFAPVIEDDRLYMIDNDGVFIALDKDSGKVVWKKQHGKLNASSPAVWRDLLLAVNLEPGQALGVRKRDGKVVWKRDLPSRAESSPVVVGGTMYFGTESGTFFALNAKNGKVRWETQLAGEVKAAPAFTRGTLYVGDYAGQMYAIRASDGDVRWQTSDLGSGLGRGGRFYSTPAVAFGRVYVGNVDGRLYSFDRQTGAIAWTHSAGDFVYSGVAAAEAKGTKPAVYFGSHDSNVYSLDAKSGDVNWQARPGGQVSGPATVIGNVVYFSTFSGNATVGFDVDTGRRIFKFDSGQYGPAVSDGELLYMLGGSELIAFEPIPVDRYKDKRGTKGIISPAEYRRLLKKSPKLAKRMKRRREDERRREQAKAEGKAGGNQGGEAEGKQGGGKAQGKRAGGGRQKN